MKTDCAIVILSEDGTRQETFLSEFLRENEFTSKDLHDLFYAFYQGTEFFFGGGASSLFRISLDWTKL